MRLLVGTVINCIMHNKANYYHPYFKQRTFEKTLYKLIKVKKWRSKMPTYEPSLFSKEKHTYSEIAMAMCQAEIVHTIIAILSYLPVLSALAFGALPVFLLTSILSSMYDMLFVIMQRYNRPKVIRLAEKKDKR